MPEVARPSTFVTVLAWLSLLWSGLSTAMGVLQSLFLLVTGFPDVPMTAAEAREIPAVVLFAFNNVHWVVLTMTLAWGVVFVTSLGLLRRREWARRSFVGLLSLAILAVAGITVVQQWAIGGFLPQTPPEPDVATFVRAVSALLGLVSIAALAWLAYRLVSKRVQAEFS